MDAATPNTQPPPSAPRPLPSAPRRPYRGLARTAGAGFVGGLLLWGVADVAGEVTTFIKLRDRGLALADASQELKDQIGYPFSPGPWYNASIGFTGGGSIAQCTFQLKGTKQITDVSVRGLREGGFVNRALYNLVGSGAWTIVDCSAMFPDGGGLVQRKSLLPKNAAEAAGLAKQGLQGSECSSCNSAARSTQGAQEVDQAVTEPQQTGTGSGDTAPATGRTGRWWWPWKQPTRPEPRMLAAQLGSDQR